MVHPPLPLHVVAAATIRSTKLDLVSVAARIDAKVAKEKAATEQAAWSTKARLSGDGPSKWLLRGRIHVAGSSRNPHTLQGVDGRAIAMATAVTSSYIVGKTRQQVRGPVVLGIGYTRKQEVQSCFEDGVRGASCLVDLEFQGFEQFIPEGYILPSQISCSYFELEMEVNF